VHLVTGRRGLARLEQRLQAGEVGVDRALGVGTEQARDRPVRHAAGEQRRARTAEDLGRGTAAQLAASLDSWIRAQNEVGSPDGLQVHLSNLFPTTYQPTTRSVEETSFGNLRAALTPRGSKSILEKLFG